MTETCLSSQSIRCFSGSGASSPLIRCPQWNRALCSRRRKAVTVPAAAYPAQFEPSVVSRASMRSHSAANDLM